LLTNIGLDFKYLIKTSEFLKFTIPTIIIGIVFNIIFCLIVLYSLFYGF